MWPHVWKRLRTPALKEKLTLRAFEKDVMRNILRE
jgi:hypothetical protein